ncbi:MAG: MATE family efflux transporter [Chlamydiota bacterium]
MSLTKHKTASLRELWVVSLPLMISLLATFMMLACDRILLAHYSTEALNAGVNASMFGWTFIVSFLVLSAIAEVFVAQYNGAKQYSMIGAPVWQMVWLGVGSAVFFIPMALWGGQIAFKGTRYAALAEIYFRWMMLFGPFFGLQAALGSFFVGRGKIYLITVISIIANIINVILDWVFIFGFKGWVAPQGIAGAAIATGISQVFIVVILGSVFLLPKYAKQYGTWCWRFDWYVFKKCFKIGAPQGLAVGLEIFGWTIFYLLLTDLGESMITIASICQTGTMLFWFFLESVSRGVTIVTGNLIGSNRLEHISKVFWQGVKLNLIFIIGVLIAFIIGIDSFIKMFFSSSEMSAEFFYALKICLLISIFYLFFEGVKFVGYGALTAAGDTFFNLVANILSVWLFLITPFYLLIFKGTPNIILAMVITLVYSIIAAAIFMARFFQGRWKSIKLIDGVQR